MATVIGHVLEMTGKYMIVSPEGKQSVLNPGDQVHKGDKVVAVGNNPDNSIDIVLGNGQHILMDQHSGEIVLDVSVIGKELFAKDDVTVKPENLEALLAKDLEDLDKMEETTAGQGGNEYADEASFTDREGNQGDARSQTSGFQYDAESNNEDNDRGNPLFAEATTAATSSQDVRSDTTDNGTASTGSTSASSTDTAAFIPPLDPQAGEVINSVDADTSVDRLNGGAPVTAVLGSDSGAAGDNTTNVNTPIISGNTEPNSTVVIVDAQGNVIGETTSDANGDYSVEVSELPEGDNELTVQVTDASGNEAQTVINVTIDTVAEAGTVTIDPITGDNVLNAQEQGEATTTVSGTATGGDIGAGDTVTVTVNGNDYTTTVNEDGTYSVEVATTDLIADGSVDVSVTSSDNAGNTVTSTITVNVNVDNGIENANGGASITAELATDSGTQGDSKTNDKTPTISGTTEANSEVVITDENGNIVGSGTSDENGNYEIEVSELSEGENELTVTVTDQAGNQAQITTNVTIDTVATEGTVTINTVADDNVLNAQEAAEATQTVSGTATGGDIKAGDDVTVTVNGNDYTTTVNEDGTYSVEVNTADIIADNSIDVRVTSSDDAGNSVSSSSSIAVTVDTQISDTGALSITNIVDNNGDYSSVTMVGTGAEIGNTITIYDEVNNAVATAEVQADGTWSADISNLAGTTINDNEFFSVTETDAAGNVTGQTESTHYWHGDWSNGNTESTDDFLMAGNGDDTINTDDTLSGYNENGYVTSTNNDTNDKVVIDGGNGNDTVTFGKDKSEYTMTIDENGNIIVAESVASDSDGDGMGDVTELRNIETIEFADDTYDVASGTFASENIDDEDNDEDDQDDSSDNGNDGDEDSDDSDASENGEHDNNGWGNGDQDAPGNSADHNNAENGSGSNEHFGLFGHSDDEHGHGHRYRHGQEDDDFDTIDGKAGFDTLVISEDVTLDFSELSENVSNIEAIALTDGTQNIEINLHDVLEMTDENNELVITGDSTDSVELDGSEWTQGDSIVDDSGTAFNVYEGGSGEDMAILKIDANIHVDIF